MRRRRQDLPLAALDELPSPAALEARLAPIRQELNVAQVQRAQLVAEKTQIEDFLVLEPKVRVAIDQLTEDVFNQTTRVLEEKLTDALQDVLRQPINLRAEVKVDQRSGRRIELSVVGPSGEPEDVLRAQGGSVANILSVGLRLFALRSLDEAYHRPVLVLDEPDAWLRPELVPRLMAMIQAAAQRLGIQTIVVTHHDPDLFRQHADKIYEFQPQPDGTVKVEVLKGEADEAIPFTEELPRPQGSLF